MKLFKFASDERIAFCFKLWVKELMDIPKNQRNDIQQTIINYALNEVFDGDYCSNEEFERKDQFVRHLQFLITKETNGDGE